MHLFAAAMLTLALAASGPTRAGTALAEARTAQEELDLARAYQVAEDGLRFGDATAEETRALWRILAELAASMDQPVVAQDAFGRLLLLDPLASPAKDASPKLVEPFEAARSKLAGGRLTAAARSIRTGARIETTVSVRGDLPGLVRGGEIRSAAVGAQPLFSARGGLRASWRCEQPSCPHWIALQDVYGNELVLLGDAEHPLPLETRAPVADAEAPRGFFASPTPWIVAASALAATGVYLAVSAARADAELGEVLDDRAAHRYAEATALDEDLHRDRLLMWTSFGAAALAGSGGVLTW